MTMDMPQIDVKFYPHVGFAYRRDGGRVRVVKHVGEFGVTFRTANGLTFSVSHEKWVEWVKDAEVLNG